MMIVVRCGSCGFVFYYGGVKPVKHVVAGDRCPRCGKPLNKTGFKVRFVSKKGRGAEELHV